VKRLILPARTPEDYEAIKLQLDNGWTLDPILTDGKPYRLDESTVWPLVKFDTEQEAFQYNTRKMGEFEDVVEVREVPHGEQVASLVKEGFTVQAIYSKSTIMVKRK